ncbi:hypothetical protein C8Q77DRAFT_486696 [Trametes polyzona]|nr:hypothetical protein C8Q77DRAFT_486696 [Trametes polyzona]
MSANLYTTMPPPPRRHPLATTANHYAVNQHPRIQKPTPGTPPKQQEQPAKPPSEPPLPRQNAKVTPPSPPKVITDKTRTLEFMRVGMLGEVCTSHYMSSSFLSLSSITAQEGLAHLWMTLHSMPGPKRSAMFEVEPLRVDQCYRYWKRTWLCHCALAQDALMNSSR